MGTHAAPPPAHFAPIRAVIRRCAPPRALRTVSPLRTAPQQLRGALLKKMCFEGAAGPPSAFQKTVSKRI